MLTHAALGHASTLAPSMGTIIIIIINGEANDNDDDDASDNFFICLDILSIITTSIIL